MLAIVSAMQKWRPYLLGKHFAIKTDHQSMKNGIIFREHIFLSPFYLTYIKSLQYFFNEKPMKNTIQTQP